MMWLDEYGKAQVDALVGRCLRTNHHFIPNFEGVPNHLAAQVAQELLRIAEASQKRAEKTPNPTDVLVAVASEKKA